MKEFIGKKILVTGGTGSFGETMVNKCLDYDCDEIRIFSRDESKQDSMRNKYNNNPRLSFLIGDIRDYQRVEEATDGIDLIFHAAALKQVPSCELHPMEAVKTNIMGTNNVIRAALDAKVKKVIFLSTDKAVYPINAMGLTKALMEKSVLSKCRFQKEIESTFCITRYGNVMASRGSVIPLFINLIKNGKPLTITDPNMTRYLMTLEEAINLVVHAAKTGNHGDTLVQKSPAATIVNLADALQSIFGVKREFKIIGTRQGEKLYESLLSREEMSRAIETENHFRVPIDQENLNVEKYIEKGSIGLSATKDYTSHNTKLLNKDELVKLLLKIDYVKKNL